MEAELWARARRGDAEARERLVALHMPLVRHVARRFAGFGHEMDDLVQAGTIGLLQAIDGFDPARGYQFSTYAVPAILGEIRRWLRASDPAGLTRAMRARVAAIRRVAEAMEQELGHRPPAAAVAERLGCDVADVTFALEASQVPVSLDEPLSSDPDASARGQRLAAPAEPDWSDAVAVRAALTQLPPRLRTIVTLRFFRDMTQAEVAAAVGLSQPQVSRLEKLALGQLRQLLAGGTSVAAAGEAARTARR
ncbi:RNA polymerase, sigma 28 subunit, FliA/WhiG subfamily [Thermaerobacter marianensis DSM 12885]|uniref:RNA polymerase sigma factor n=1 Tax=Thermaerobacter marianensis (strain ATCC 700841 / DSM 12885 / JCM 10246 / 7p75a) TaxID=644966 RepID=E6SKP5_THEM7|nr:sigma-70 family RNA polymerase sigma factor [Thermaerobacter marianensis]ADU51253.1 RNA polymerase, sigma 28 subunit, FliA/WhiG subfamily [Thermaerobacter marianensis DSM 12885]